MCLKEAATGTIEAVVTKSFFQQVGTGAMELELPDFGWP